MQALRKGDKFSERLKFCRALGSRSVHRAITAKANTAAAGLDGSCDVLKLPARKLMGCHMRKLADYTLGVVIVLVHLVIMSWQNERPGLGVGTIR